MTRTLEEGTMRGWNRDHREVALRASNRDHRHNCWELGTRITGTCS